MVQKRVSTVVPHCWKHDVKLNNEYKLVPILYSDFVMMRYNYE